MSQVENPVDWDKDDEPDPGSALAVAKAAPPPIVNGTIKDVPVELIYAAHGQRQLSKAWVDKNAKVGWNPVLGFGIVVNTVPVSVVKQSPVAANPDAQAALHAAGERKSKNVYADIIGQHRVALARRLGLPDLPAMVTQNLSDEDCMRLFVEDARSTRPLRGFDVHNAALVMHEPRAEMIEDTFDQRGIELVAGSPKANQISCIRAIEKACGPAATSAQAPDQDRLDWHFDVLTMTLPKAQYPDALVRGLTFALQEYEGGGIGIQQLDPAAIGKSAYRQWKGDPKLVVDAMRNARKVMTAPSPHVAATFWKNLFLGSGFTAPTPVPTNGGRKGRAKTSA